MSKLLILSIDTAIQVSSSVLLLFLFLIRESPLLGDQLVLYLFLGIQLILQFISLIVEFFAQKEMKIARVIYLVTASIFSYFIFNSLILLPIFSKNPVNSLIDLFPNSKKFYSNYR